MRNVSKAFIAIILAGSAAVTSASAHDIVVKAATSFRDIEYSYGADGVDMAKSLLDARIPVGTQTAAARAIVRAEGAHCGTVADEGQTRCTFESIEGVDALQDIVWTVKLNSHEGRIADLDVSRTSVGPFPQG